MRGVLMSDVGLKPDVEKEHLDELTGLHNLRGFFDHLQGGGDYTTSEKSVIIYINVMNFKSFNQKYGFSGGNEFLKGFAYEIQNIFTNELIARTGGDQFIILANSLTEKQITDKIDAIREASIKHEKGLKLHIKAGIYMATGEEDDPVLMVDRAKIACDDIIRLYDKDNNIYSEELGKKNELKQYVIDNFESAFKNKYFKVYYQKEVRALTEKICGYEALARWMDPEHGIISPAIFVEVLESVHLIHKMDIFIIEQVCADIKSDMERGYGIQPVSVNLSRLDFELCDIMAEIDKCREKYDIPKDLLNIEVTESAIASGVGFLGDQIRKFRDAGYQVWMDDFGAGYSSFGNLKSYDFDVIKIDMSFIREFETNKKSGVILATIVNMAKELGIHTLAEGVETREQFEFLREIGCEKIQGYLFGKPTPLEDFTEEDFSDNRNEDYQMHAYYNSIGGINFLGSTPLRPKKLEVYNNIPIGLYEIKGNTMTYIYANRAYNNVLSSLGVADADEANQRNKMGEMYDVRTLIKYSEQAEHAVNNRAEFDIVISGSLVNTKIRFIARNGDKSAFAIVTRNLSIHEEGNKSENAQVAMAHVFNQYFRVDLYDEDGTVENLFLNVDQMAVADREPDAIKATEIYSKMYVFEDERERFLKFYDIPTVRDRVKKSTGDYIVDYFHSAIPGDNGRLQMYMLLPFYYNGRWKYISCCRYADEINEQQLYN